MKRKDFIDLKTKEVKDLEKLVAQKKKEVQVGSSRNLRREIAKILTLIKEKELAGKLKTG